MSEFRALLLTDVVDSTRIAETIGDAAMAVHWAAHDQVTRDLLRTWHGREIERTDGLLAVFDSAKDAAGFAVEYHRALAGLDLPFKARAGLHVGPLTFQENAIADIAVGARRLEVGGLALHITARIMAVATGGQTLLSSDARTAVGDSRLRVQSHGYWRLKGAREPVELFEIGDGQSPFMPPRDEDKAYRVVRQGELWMPAREVKHSLPAERDTFVGRSDALLDLAQKIELGARLVSVLGMGGAGKTRLVTRFAWNWLGDFPGGAWFCDLSQARGVDGILFAVAQGLDIPLGRSDPAAQLAHAIAGRGKCLVILDNFEQVARYAEQTLGGWLDVAPEAHFVVTTREILGIAGEEAYALVPMSVKDSTSLFLNRAQSARHDFRASLADLSAIEELAKVLDGLPLAIELAAARIRAMSPGTLLANMSERFKVLSSRGGRRDRQATLRTAFDWSWDLLSETEKTALAQLSVFEGGFTLESAEAILDFSTVGVAPWTADIVQSLADKSFIRRISDDRFDLLESVRFYAAEHLGTERRFTGSGAAAQVAAEQRHGGFFAQLGPKRAVNNACVEIDNLVVACKRAVSRGDADTAVRTLAGAWGALNLRGPFSVGIEMSELVQTVDLLPVELAASVERIYGSALMRSGRTAEARKQFELAISKSNDIADHSVRRILANLAELSMREGSFVEALEYFRQAFVNSSDVADPSFECDALNGMGTCHQYLGDLDAAWKHYEQALGVARDHGERRWEGGALGNLGQLNANRGRMAEARQYYESAIAIAQELGDRQWEGNVRCNLGLLHHSEGRMVEAVEHLNAALNIARQLGHAQLECVVLCNLGIVLEAQGDSEAARERYVQAVGLARALGDRRSEGQFLGYLGLLHATQGQFGQADECFETGAELLHVVSDRVSLGVLLCAKAEAAGLSGAPAKANILLGEVEALAEELAVEPESEFGIALAKARQRLASAGPQASISETSPQPTDWL